MPLKNFIRNSKTVKKQSVTFFQTIAKILRKIYLKRWDKIMRENFFICFPEYDNFLCKIPLFSTIVLMLVSRCQRPLAHTWSINKQATHLIDSCSNLSSPVSCHQIFKSSSNNETTFLKRGVSQNFDLLGKASKKLLKGRRYNPGSNLTEFECQ